MTDRPSTTTGRHTLGGATCRQHQFKLVEKMMVDRVAYVGAECVHCGHRNISTDGDPANVDRRWFDLFVGWKFRQISNIAFEAGDDAPTWWLDGTYERPAVEVRRGHLELAALNVSLSHSVYNSASPNAERL